jgi:parvulin-like peptidyl-prolyl isomerase
MANDVPVLVALLVGLAGAPQMTPGPQRPATPSGSPGAPTTTGAPTPGVPAPGTPARQGAPTAPEAPGQGRAATAPASAGVIIQRILVKVNGEIFTQKELEQEQIDKLQQDGKTSPTPADLQSITPDILVGKIDEMLIVQRGRELGFHLSDEQFASSVQKIKTDNKLDDAAFKVALGQEGLTLDALRERLERSYIVQTVQQKEILAHMNLTEEEARQYYEKHPDEFVKPAAVTMREILIAVPTDTKNASQPFSPNLDATAKAKIADLRDRAAKGEDFVKLVAEASDAPTKAAAGLIGPIDMTDLSTGIRDAIDKMNIGDVTPSFRTSRGYQIFRLESRTKAERLPFDQVRDEVAQRVGETRLDVEMKKYLGQLRSQALIEWKSEDLHQMYDKRLAEK